MLRSSVLRPAGVSCLALAYAKSLQHATRHIVTSSSRRGALPFAPRSLIPSFQYQPRFYSTEAEEATATTDAQNEAATPGRVTRFEDLRLLGVHDQVVDSIVKGMGYTDMTEVQSMTINSALKGKDMVAQAKTGTGKTLAFLVPVIQRILQAAPSLAHFDRRARPRPDDIRAIIVSPTRELAEQIGQEARKLVRGTGIQVQTAVGGTQKRMMLRQIQYQGCHLLVATPGRLKDLLEDRHSGVDAPNLGALVLDEADRMLDVGFEDTLKDIIRILPDRSRVPRQTLLFSATIPKNVVGIARTYIDPKNFEFCQTIRPDDAPTHEKVPQFIVTCKGMENVYPTLLELLKREMQKSRADPNALPLKAIVYCPTTSSVQLAHRVFEKLSNMHRLPEVMAIHSKLEQDKRTRVASWFRKAQSAILFSSDVTARGMDFPEVSHVIQLSPPNEREQYIHRIGRTGRANKTGQGYLLISELELRKARDTLAGLPINRHTELEMASFDARSEPDKPELFRDVASVCQKLPYNLLSETYLSLLGGALQGVHKMDIVEDLYYASKHAWGLEEPPAISSSVARNRGVARSRYIRIDDTRHDDRDDRDGFGGNGGFGGGRGLRGGFGDRSGGRGGRNSGDGFDAMRSDNRGGDRRGRARPSF